MKLTTSQKRALTLAKTDGLRRMGVGSRQWAAVADAEAWVTQRVVDHLVALGLVRIEERETPIGIQTFAVGV